MTIVEKTKRVEKPNKRALKRKLHQNEAKTIKKLKVQAEPVPARKSVTGIVLVCGQGDVGQLGLGPDIMEKKRPCAVPNLENVVEISAGGMHSVCLNDKGEVMTFGCNDEGALGRFTNSEGSDEELECYPGKVVLPKEAVKVSAGDSHSAALLLDGTVFVWGTFRDSHGTLGLTEDHLKSDKPIKVQHSTKFINIASGADHLVLLDDTGFVFTCGCAEQGQLGRINSRSCDRNDGRSGIGAFLIPSKVEFKLTLKMKVENIWAGTYSSFTKSADKTDLFVFGLNNYRQLGLAERTITAFFPMKSQGLSKNIKWTKISAGPHHTLALDDKGHCYAIGRHEYGRLGLGKLEADATEICLIPSLSEKRCVDIACGLTSSFAVTEEGLAYAWGMGGNGELGTGDDEDVDTPVQITGKQINDKKVIAVRGGGQHTMFLAVASNDTL